jgi:hypothetical protein
MNVKIEKWGCHNATAPGYINTEVMIIMEKLLTRKEAANPYLPP